MSLSVTIPRWKEADTMITQMYQEFMQLMQEISNEQSKEQAIQLLRKKFGDINTSEKQSNTSSNSSSLEKQISYLKKEIEAEK